ncbi:MAG TPA: HAMP domain-containing sensor histidine kinase [Ktedonobacteraceae bacterium]|nr:HAMP domain-containing sensor histidine kinase [Ktedonobacteraceae bacterium]
MKRAAPHHFHVSLTQSVRLRLTLWYLAVMVLIVFIFGGSLYATQTFLNADATESKLQAQLYQDSQRFAQTYEQALLDRQALTGLHLNLSSQEMVLLLQPGGSVLDERGPLAGNMLQQLQARAGQSVQVLDLTVPQNSSQGRRWSTTDHGWNWWAQENVYRILFTPVLHQNTRLATLLVGLPRRAPIVPFLAIWLFHGTLALLAAAIGGYWLAGKALRPVKMITRTANEINATDLRRRLHLKRRDEFGELAATFDQMLARLEAAFKRQARFTTDASHELRTPLTIINLEINRALTQLERPEEYRQILEQIQAENEQMTYIVNNLLILARADTGQVVLQREVVDISDLALACVERLLPLAQQSHIVLSTGALPELFVSGDPQYLSQVLTNLLENAIKYTSGIGTHVHVELACEQMRRAVLSVQDDGPGIAEEHLPLLFERFYRVDKARRQRTREQADRVAGKDEPGGTGLGLAIVQWIVQAHDGEVRVESKPGSGSTFQVRLPLLS